jgi:hypothetical protein
MSSKMILQNKDLFNLGFFRKNYKGEHKAFIEEYISKVWI